MDGLRQIGSRYTVETLLGRGSAGQVWLGHDVDGRRWAIKVLRHELAEDPGVVRQFVQERAALGSIRHPHVVGVHDLVVEGTTLAIVMDLVDGSDMRAVLDTRTTLPPAEVARCGAQLAGALGAAHAAGIAHRDLKPENVLVDGATGTIRLTDFGIAQLMDASSMTPERVAGTPQYMAPEVADGYVDSSTGDLYSLGVLLYELCCSSTPFAGRGSALATMKAHATEVPRRPDGVPDQLWAVISDLLAKDPTRRPQSADVVEARLVALAPELVGLPSAGPVPVAGARQLPVTRVPDDRTVWGVSRHRARPGRDGSTVVAGATAPEDAFDEDWGDDPRRRRRVLVGAGAAVGAAAVAGLVAVLTLGGDPGSSVGEAPVGVPQTAPSGAAADRGPTGAPPLPTVTQPAPSSSTSLPEVTVAPRRGEQRATVVPAPSAEGSGPSRRTRPPHSTTPAPTTAVPGGEDPGPAPTAPPGDGGDPTPPAPRPSDPAPSVPVPPPHTAPPSTPDTPVADDPPPAPPAPAVSLVKEPVTVVATDAPAR